MVWIDQQLKMVNKKIIKTIVGKVAHNQMKLACGICQHIWQIYNFSQTDSEKKIKNLMWDEVPLPKKTCMQNLVWIGQQLKNGRK